MPFKTTPNEEHYAIWERACKGNLSSKTGQTPGPGTGGTEIPSLLNSYRGYIRQVDTGLYPIQRDPTPSWDGETGDREISDFLTGLCSEVVESPMGTRRAKKKGWRRTKNSAESSVLSPKIFPDQCCPVFVLCTQYFALRTELRQSHFSSATQ